MIKRTPADLVPYDAPGHYGVVCKRYHGKAETEAEKFWIGISEFEPGGGAEYAYETSAQEKVYYVLEGEMTVYMNGEKYVLKKYDSIHFDVGDTKTIINETTLPASMLVIAAVPK